MSTPPENKPNSHINSARHWALIPLAFALVVLVLGASEGQVAKFGAVAIFLTGLAVKIWGNLGGDVKRPFFGLDHFFNGPDSPRTDKRNFFVSATVVVVFLGLIMIGAVQKLAEDRAAQQQAAEDAAFAAALEEGLRAHTENIRHLADLRDEAVAYMRRASAEIDSGNADPSLRADFEIAFRLVIDVCRVAGINTCTDGTVTYAPFEAAEAEAELIRIEAEIERLRALP